MAPRKKTIVEADVELPKGNGKPDVEVAPVEEAPVEKPKASKTEVIVRFRDHNGEPTQRTFSLADHGENFAELAEEFRKTNLLRIIA